MTRTFPRLFLVFAIGCGTTVQDLGHDPPSGPGAPPPAPVSIPGPPATAGAGALGAEAIPPTWEWLNPAPQGNRIRSMGGSADDDVWLVGDGNTALHWDGEKWRDMRGTLRGLDLYSVWSSGPDDVWAVGDHGVEYEFHNYDPTTPLYTRHSLGTGAILHFDGTMWKADPHIGTRWAHAVWGASSSCVFALLENGDVARYDGTGWSITASPASAVLRDVWGTSPSNVWAVGDQGALVRFDGTRWTKVGPGGDGDPTASTNRYYGVWGTSPDDVWAVFDDTRYTGWNTTVDHTLGFSHWDGAAWHVVQRQWLGTSYGDAFVPDTAEPFRTGHALWGTPGGRPVALSHDSFEAWSYDGQSWVSEPIEWSAGVRTVWGASDMLAAGEGGGLYKLDAQASGAARWTALFAGFRENIFDIGVAAPNDVWARVGDETVGLVRWTTGGWSKVHVLASDGSGDELAVDALAVVSPTEVWMAGHHQKNYAPVSEIARWDGARWNAVPPPEAGGVGAISAPKAGAPWVLSSERLFRRSGTAWAEVTLPAKNTPIAVTAIADDDVWVIGDPHPNGDPLWVTVFHFDGTSVEDVFHAYGGQQGASVSVAAPDDVWVTAGEQSIIGTPWTLYHWDGKRWTDHRDLDAFTVLPAGNGRAYFLRFDGAETMFYPSDARSVLGYWDGAKATILGETSASVGSLGASTDALWIVGAAGATLRYPLTPGVR
jgi:hypothetical protein